MKQLKKNLSYLFKWAPSAFSRFKELTEMATYPELSHFNPNCLTSNHFHCGAICLELVNDINNTQSKGGCDGDREKLTAELVVLFSQQEASRTRVCLSEH